MTPISSQGARLPKLSEAPLIKVRDQNDSYHFRRQPGPGGEHRCLVGHDYDDTQCIHTHWQQVERHSKMDYGRHSDHYYYGTLLLGIDFSKMDEPLIY